MKNDNFKATNAVHNIILEGRERISISGVLDVESFDEQEIVMETSKGGLSVRGSELRVEKLSIETGDTVIEGSIECVEYVHTKGKRGAFWSKLF